MLHGTFSSGFSTSLCYNFLVASDQLLDIFMSFFLLVLLWPLGKVPFAYMSEAGHLLKLASRILPMDYLLLAPCPP